MNTLTKQNVERPSPVGGFQFEIGDVTCRISCADSRLLATLWGLYQDFATSRPPDFSIEIEVVDRLKHEEIEPAICHSEMHYDGRHFSSSGLTLEGEVDREKHRLRLAVERHLFDDGLDYKLMNRILPKIYSTVCHEMHGTLPAFLVHSCSIVRHGRVMIFTGPSEVGKTTLARMCGEEHGHVLNDEVALVSRPQPDTGTIWVRGSPIIGGYPQRRNAMAPLRCVLLLKQSRRTAITPVGKTESYLKFMHQVISPAHLGPYDHKAFLSLVAEFSEQVTRNTPFYILEFTLERAPLWRAIEELERSLDEEEQNHA